MSIFKLKQWWSNRNFQNDEFEEGIQNSTCIKVEKFNSHSDKFQFNDIVLQIETGKFLMDNADQQIIVLHPNSYEVYVLERKTGHIDIGEQNSLISVIKHSFTRRAYSVICGPFGSSKSKHLICIQALDGTLSFFDQDTFLFMCMFNDIIIPGPICYVANSDQFVICKSTWVFEIYSYQQLSEFSELSFNQNNKHIPQWAYNAGEEILSVQVIRSSSNFSSILMLGERHLYCFQDNGLMKYMIRFDYMPVCFFAYLIGWYYEPSSRLLVMVTSENSKLNIYEDTKLLWSCDLNHKAISISRCFLNSLSGGIVTLLEDGTVIVSYLGTEPDLNSNASPITETMDPGEVQLQIDEVEKSLQKVLDAKEEIEETYADFERVVTSKISIGQPIKTSTDYTMEPVSVCPVFVTITAKEPKLIQSIQVTYDCTAPIVSSETTVCLENINGTEIIETFINLSGSLNITRTSIMIILTVIDATGKIRTIEKTAFVPLTLFCSFVEPVTDHDFSLPIKINRSQITFKDIFNDFAEQQLSDDLLSENIISFVYHNSDKTVTLKISDGVCSIEANTFSEIVPIVEYFIQNLNNRMESEVMDFQIICDFDGEIIRQIMQTFLKSIEGHVKERIILKSLEEELNVLQRQFTVIQKRLLVQYGSHPPGNCDHLEFLMKDTHERIKTVSNNILESKEYVLRASGSVRGAGYLLMNVLKDAIPDNTKEWEEAVFQGSSYILNKILQKSDKDKEKLAPLTDQDILSKSNVKKLLKQLRLILEKVFSEIKDITDLGSDTTRIQEFVEVI
ncbi:parathyroid hormone-responsive B1 [Danaus plexippus plexippus]|uniref:Parathyroid hormone-responsive B1 n=1 Tax=Danaus plexippus plexippus TaxID=278856 RepID=A0A212EUU0_DANPL|nr:parathyroid hormone-responsive B1 [Danaus plexippus plexippus]